MLQYGRIRGTLSVVMYYNTIDLGCDTISYFYINGKISPLKEVLKIKLFRFNWKLE